MKALYPNNVKIYDLTSGQNLPEWLNESKKRLLQRKKADPRKIELIQDFGMPHIVERLKMSKDRRYIMATGTYKPRLRVYDTQEMSMKYEKHFNTNAIQMELLEADYSKMVFLFDDRYFEFHAKYGNILRKRIPKYGRDMAYHASTCDLYFAALGNQIYRLNLEQGKFMNSLTTNAMDTKCCEFNPQHQLFTCGTANGTVECWDPRTRFRVGEIDCASASYEGEDYLSECPQVTTITHRDGLVMGVGLSTGKILLYDIRARNPTVIKDHCYDLPIKSLHFHEQEDLVLSMDKRVVKMWHRTTGKPYTHIEPTSNGLNDLAVIPETGLLFIAQEAPKILSYYVPSIGPAPKWCSFLDNMTEELEESQQTSVYDNYKFVTPEELKELNLDMLIGTNMVKAYMHGFFININMYKKAKIAVDPFAYEDYRQKKIREKIESERGSRISKNKSGKLPKINTELAEKIISNTEDSTEEGLLKDDRFAALFNNEDYSIDKSHREFQRIHHVTSTKEAAKSKRKPKADLGKQAASENIDATDNVNQRHDTEMVTVKRLTGDFAAEMERELAQVQSKVSDKKRKHSDGEELEYKDERTEGKRSDLDKQTHNEEVSPKAKKKDLNVQAKLRKLAGERGSSADWRKFSDIKEGAGISHSEGGNIKKKLKKLAGDNTAQVEQETGEKLTHMNKIKGSTKYAEKKLKVSTLNNDKEKPAWKKQREDLQKQFSEIETDTKKNKHDSTLELSTTEPKFYEVKAGDTLKDLKNKHYKLHAKTSKMTLEERVADTFDQEQVRSTGFGSKEMTFRMKDEKKMKKLEEQKKHREERKAVRRHAGSITKRTKVLYVPK